MIRRALLCVSGAALALLAGAPAVLAVAPPSNLTPLTDARASSSSVTPALSAMAETLPGPCTVTGQILRADGAASAGARVFVFYEAAGETLLAGSVTTSADGSFSVAGVPETTAGEIDVYLPGGNSFWTGGHTYAEAGPNHFVLQPGLVAARLSARPSSTWKPPLLVETYGGGSAATTVLNGISGNALAAPPDLTYAVAYTYVNQAIEWFASAPRTITAGRTSGSLWFSLRNARGAWLTSPPWDSGRPGTLVKVALNNWPKNAKIGFSGYPLAPSGAAKTWTPSTASGAETISRSLRIPGTAPAGYSYAILVTNQRAGSRLELRLTFQVASLTASRTSVTRGQSVRLKGIVPTEGHWGATPGKTKLVTVYKRTTAAGQPTRWDARRNGWTVVGTYTTNRSGVFTTPYFRPTRTTWYVAAYAGDRTYHPAFTSVLRVPVK